MPFEIPTRLERGTPAFLRLASGSKAPIPDNSARDGPFFHRDDPELVQHLGSGGNVARVLRDELIAIDVDSERLAEDLAALPDTFAVESGGDGFGYHRYYVCPGWEGNQIELSADRVNHGSIRSGNSYCLCPPSIHDETGDRYQVHADRRIAEVSADRLRETLASYLSESANTGAAAGGGSAAAAAGVGGDDSPADRRGADADLPADYPARGASWSTCRKWLESNDLLDRLNQTSSADWSGDEFAVAKCLAEGGFAPATIAGALDRFHHNSKWHNRGENYRRLTVQKAIEAAAEDSHVDWSDPAYKRDGERRKNEFGAGTAEPEGGESMSATYTDKEEVTILEGSDDGDDFRKVVLVEREEDGETVEYVALKKGVIEKVQTVDGDDVLAERITDSKSLGSPDYIGELVEGLAKLDEELNGN